MKYKQSLKFLQSKNYNFKEAKFGNGFALPKLAEVKKLIDAGSPFTLVGMPGVGATTFLRFLAMTDLAYFVFVDLYELTSPDKSGLFKLLLGKLSGDVAGKSDQQVLDLCHRELAKLAQRYPKVVIIFNRFQQLKRDFDPQFFANLRCLRNADRENIVIIATANRTLAEISPEALGGFNLSIFARNVYLQPYPEEDLIRTEPYYREGSKLNKDDLEKVCRFSGGHHVLFQLLLKSGRLGKPLDDPFIKLQVKQLYEYLSFTQRKTVLKIALGKKIDKVDDYLLDVGLVKKTGKDFQLFTPLLTEYLQTCLPVKLPAKEAKLFALLKKNLGMLVGKEEIFHLLWPASEDFDLGSDWALNSLVYRMKKNPAFKSSGYIVESCKKLGYTLYKD